LQERRVSWLEGIAMGRSTSRDLALILLFFRPDQYSF
jgi:hypothetical protein